MPKLIVCLTGMPGAGKSTIADGLQARGYEVANMGNAVRAEARRRNLEPTGENLGSLMLELRERDGPGAVAMLIAPQIREGRNRYSHSGWNSIQRRDRGAPGAW